MRIVTSDLFYCGEARAKLLKQQIMSLATLLTSVSFFFFFKAQGLKILMKFNGKKKTFSTNGPGTTGYLY